MTLELTDAQSRALLGMMDVAIKHIGIRVMDEDVAGLLAAIKSAHEVSLGARSEGVQDAAAIERVAA